MRRAGSVQSTLSTMQRRATRYQKYLTLASVILIITSTIVIFSSVLLIRFYHLPTLAFWSSYFQIAPILMISLGAFKFIAACYGFGITGTENRGLLAFFAVLLCVAFVGQLASIFTAIEVRTTVTLGEYGSADFTSILSKYQEDSGIKSSWDRMQMDMRCCGGLGELDGYLSYQNTPMGLQEGGHSVPDSCCITPSEGCGRGILNLARGANDQRIRNNIWVTGCIDALKYRLDNDVQNMMAVYAGVGVLIALIELIAVVLTSAFIAQISRRRNREEMMWNSVRNADDGYDHRDAAKALNPSVEHETVC